MGCMGYTATTINFDVSQFVFFKLFSNVFRYSLS